MSNNKSEKFSIGDIIPNKNQKMIITKIKKVELTADGKLLVQGLWKEDEVNRLLRKFGRNKV